MFWWREQVDDGLWVAFTDAAAGNLAVHVGDDETSVRRRRSQLAAEMGLEDGRLQFMNQVHSARVARTDHVVSAGASGGGAPEADAMVSPSGHEPLAVMVADCLPVVLAGFHPNGRSVAGTAVIHAGRRGLTEGVVPAAVEELRSTGAARIKSWIGPAVCGQCYEVPAEMADAVEAEVPGTRTTTKWGTAGLDLATGANRQLAGMGVDVEHIAGCTMEEARLFSYRRDQHAGRFAGLVWRDKTE